MKLRILALFLLELFFSAPTSAQTSILWQTTFGGSQNDGAQSIVATRDGGFIFAGAATSNDGDIKGSHGSFDLWIVKLSSAGAIEWEYPYGGSNADQGYAVIETKDGGYAVAGSTSSNDGDVPEGTKGGDDFWILKLSSQGAIQWQKTFGGSNNDEAYSITQTPDGGFAVAGSTYSSDGDVTSSHGSTDWWIIKLDTSGKLLWQTSLGSQGADEAHSIISTMDGGLAVAGWSGEVGGDVTRSLGSADFWVVKLDANGHLIWQRSFGGSSGDFAYSIVQTADSGFALTGATSSSDGDVKGLHSKDTSDLWLIKISKSGDLQWQKTFGGSAQDMGQSIALTNDGALAVAGYTRSRDGDVAPIVADSGTYDGWLIQTDSLGNLLSNETLGGEGDDFLYSAATIKAGGLVLAGVTTSLIQEGGGFSGHQQAWVARMGASGSGVRVSAPRRSRSSVYPNPSSGNVSLALLGFGNSEVEIHDVVGRLVAKRSISSDGLGNYSAKFDLSSMPSGVYFYRALSNGGASSGRFQILH